MAEKIVVDGEIVDDVGQDFDADQSLLEKEELDASPTEPKQEDFESEEEFTAALEQHKTDNPPEPWLATDLDDVPVQTHIRVKQRLKGTISEQNEELDTLRQENAALKASKVAPKVLKRPNEDDFDDPDGYKTALGQYEQDLVQQEVGRVNQENHLKEVFEQEQLAIKSATDDHYKRADKLIADSGIEPERYKKADETVRMAVETVFPKVGELLSDKIITFIGKGSEKVLYYLGNNKNALNEFKSLLIEDKSGMKAAIYLGQQKERLTNPKKRTSLAPKPSPNLKGDETGGSNGKALLKSYKKAHTAGNTQAAYNAKKEARKAGVDVSTW